MGQGLHDLIGDYIFTDCALFAMSSPVAINGLMCEIDTFLVSSFEPSIEPTLCILGVVVDRHYPQMLFSSDG
jgi:hypothetical protein